MDGTISGNHARDSGRASLADFLEAHVRTQPERPLYTWLDGSGQEAGSLTRGGLDLRARAVASRLIGEAGLAAGDRALLLFAPGLEFIAAFLGCLYAGVVAVPAYPPSRRSMARLTGIARDAEPAAVLTTASLMPRVTSWLEERSDNGPLTVDQILAVDEVWDATAPEASRRWQRPPRDGADLAFLQYTSGSTGTPKGVRVTHANLVHNEEMIRRAFAQSEESVIVSWLPLYHDMGLIGGVLQPLYLGARCILTSPAAFLRRPRLWLEAIDRYRGTTSGGPDFGYALVESKVGPEEREGLDLSSWTVAFNGSEPVRGETLERFARAFAPNGFRRRAFYPCYGMAEATLLVTGGDAAAEPVVSAFDAAALEDHRAEPAESEGRALVGCGRTWRGQRLEIVDPESRRPLPAGRVGEIWVAGPSVADGYWRQPEATEHAFAARLAGVAEGEESGPFLRTGDLGFLGDDGELFVTGRLKDLIILRGRNVYPHDVERTAEAAHDALRAGCSAAFPVEAGGEERMVLAVEVDRHFDAGDPAAVRQVTDAVRRAVFKEHEAALHEVVLLRVGTLPKTSSGKVRRRACRTAYLGNGLEGAVAAQDRGFEDSGSEDSGSEDSGSEKRGIEEGWTDAGTPAAGAAAAAPSRETLAALDAGRRRQAVADLLTAWVAAALCRPADDLDAASPLIAQGLDSLSAAELSARMEGELGVGLDFGDLLEGASVAELAELAAEALGAGAAASEDAAPERFETRGDPGSGPLPLSRGQEALWFLHRLDPSSAAYHITVGARVVGDLDAAALERALVALARRHPQLRATFHDLDGEPVQRVAPPRAAAVELLRPEPGREAAPWGDEAARARLLAEARRPFDLARGPLLRAVILPRGEDAEGAAVADLALVVHHLVADFWSLVVLFEELEELYTAEIGDATGSADTLAAPAARFSDFVEWERRRLAGPEGEALEAWWRRELSDGAVADLDLPTDRPRPAVLSDRGGAVAAPLGEGASRAVEKLRHHALQGGHGTTPFTVLLAAFQGVLSRYTGQRDFLLGTPAALRGQPRLARVVGYLVNPVVLRADLAAGGDGAEPGLGELARRAAATANAAFDHQAFPFPRLTEILRPVRDSSRSPLFQVFVSYQSAPGGRRDLSPFALGVEGGEVPLGPLTLSSLPLAEPPAQFDLNLLLGPGPDGATWANAVYSRDLFDAATIERLLGHLATLLVAGAEAPERPLSELPLMTPAERRQLLVAWNDTAAPVPEPALIHAAFESRAAEAPQRVALRHGDTALTYGELDRRCDRLAARLAARGVGPEVVVAVCVERSPAMLVALLAVLKAGGAYLPLDPTYPVERLAYALEDSTARLVLLGESLRESVGESLVPALAGGDDDGSAAAVETLLLDAGGEAVGDEAGAAAAPATPGEVAGHVAAAPDNAAYLIYTSGSTGRPKGVAVPHRAMVNFLASMIRRPGLGPEDVLYSVTTPSFDIAGLELFGPLSVGAEVVVATGETLADGAALGAALTRFGATVMQATPTTWRLLLEAGWPVKAPLKALCGGEPMPRPLAEELSRRAASLWNMYGPTETTVWSAVARVEATDPGSTGGAAAAPVSIGTPIANTRVLLLDPHGRPVPAGVPGELCIGGDGLARGYHRRPALTADRFVPDPLAGEAGEDGGRLYRTGDLARWNADGSLGFLGRLDHQVKVRGVRIELGEIETALAGHRSVQQAVVATREAAAGDVRLVAWVLPVEGAEMPAAAELRAHLASSLPEAYLPSRFVAVGEIPLTPNGKVDRAALPEPSSERSSPDAGAPPGSEMERRVAALWCELLGVDRVGSDENFFDLGGHSLLVTRLQARLAAAGHDVEVVDLFRHPTVASLARRLEAGADAGADAGGAAEAAARAASARSRATPEALSGDVAVVGYAGRFPKAGSVAELWRRVAAGEECITFFDEEELRRAGVDEELLADPAYVPAAAVLDRPARFDAAFFGYTPREAELMDPQHRVFLECAWQALEDAGYDPRRAPGRVGVFAAAGLNTYLLYSGLRPGSSMAGGYQAFIGNDKDFVPTRVSYELDLKGPSVNVQTACSSSLVAVHLACRSLRSGESDMALAGGVTIRVPFAEGYLHEEGGIPSPDGHCRAFDAAGAGTVLGSGAGVVTLKRLEDAVADGDAIRAVIKGSAINNDGAGKMGYTAPSVDGQAAVIAGALAAAGVSSRSVSYVEAHGTGTALGDPIEVAALSEAFRATAGDGPEEGAGPWCALGSLKTNIGHLDTAAGVAGLIKAVVALERRAIPPSLHYSSPNPKIDFAASPFRVATELTPWRRNGTPRRAGVSSFGIGGTNAHVVLEEAPEVAPAAEDAGPGPRRFQLLPLSARTGSALERATAALGAALGDAETAPTLADAAWTLQAGRHPMAHRRVVVAEEREAAAAALAAGDPGDPSAAEIAAWADGTAPGDRPEVAFLFPGQGAQHPAAGRLLHAEEPAFRRALEEVCALFTPHLDRDLLEVLVGAGADSPDAARALARTEIAQPAIFALEWALARTWRSWGVVPAALLGHSLGEYVAATLAGVFTLDDAAALVAARGRLMGELDEGDMLSVEIPDGDGADGGAPDAETWLDRRRAAGRIADEVALAAVNAPGSVVLSGPAPAVAETAARMAEDGVRHRILHTSHAFHSSMMDPILDRFAAEVARRNPRAPEIPMVSSVTGDWLTAGEATDPAYWSRQLRNPVRFAASLARLAEVDGRLLLEVGPGRGLTQLARRAAAGRVVPSLPQPRDPQPETASLTEAVGRLWLAGVEIDWAAYAAGRPRRRASLPAYPFEGDDHMLPAAGRHASPDLSAEAGAAAGRSADPASWYWLPVWEPTAPPAAPGDAAMAESGPWLLVLDPAGALEEVARRLRAAGARVSTVRPDQGFVELGGDDYLYDPSRRDDADRLLAALDAADALPRRLVHGLNLGLNPGPDLGDAGVDLAERAEAARTAAFHSLLHLASALESAGALAGGRRVELTAVSSGAARLTGDARPRPERALLLGPVRALPQDCPGLTCRAVDLDPGDEADAEALADDLLAELFAGDLPGDSLPGDRLPGDPAAERVAWRAGQRHVEAHRRLRLDAGEVVPGLTDGGAYWITGGLGGIGFAIARELAERHGARLLLTGRSELPPPEDWDPLLGAPDLAGAGTTPAPDGSESAGEEAVPRTVTAAEPEMVEKVRRLRRLESAGAEVLYVTADVTDRRATAAALAAGEERFGPLHGVIHAAGLPGGGLAQAKSAAEAERVLAPKVDGAVVLGELLAPRLAAGELPFLLFASSINGVVGGFGQTDYAAANAFLDAYADSLPRRRGSRAVAVAWDRWRGTGMAADETGDLLASLARGGGAPHPLLGRRVPASDGRHLWSGVMAPERHWALDDHRVLGMPTLPGTTYLEMARAAWAELGGGAVTFSDVAFLAPLMVADGDRRRSLTVLEEAGGEVGAGDEVPRNAYTFRVSSQGSDGTWVEHARGRLAPAAGEDGSEESGEPGERDVEALRLACDRRTLTAADVAEAVEEADAGGAGERFLVTGPRWRALRSLAVGEGQALARFELEPALAGDLDRLPLHPALLDVAAGAVRFLADGNYLPLAYQSMTVHGAMPRAGYSHLTLHGDPSAAGATTLTCDLAVLDEAGGERLVVTGFTMRRVEPAAAREMVAGAEAAAASTRDASTSNAGTGDDAGSEDSVGHEPAPGLAPSEGVETFRRILAGPAVPRVVVSTRDLETVRREVRRMDRDHLAERLSALAAGPAGRATTAATAAGGDGELSGDLETRIAAAWRRVLGVERVGSNDNFFELGGTSLAGIQLIAELKKELGVEIPTVAIFEAPTVAALARHLAPDEESEATAERARDRAEKKKQALKTRRPPRRPRRPGRRA